VLPGRESLRGAAADRDDVEAVPRIAALRICVPAGRDDRDRLSVRRPAQRLAAYPRGRKEQPSARPVGAHKPERKPLVDVRDRAAVGRPRVPPDRRAPQCELPKPSPVRSDQEQPSPERLGVVCHPEECDRPDTLRRLARSRTRAEQHERAGQKNKEGKSRNAAHTTVIGDENQGLGVTSACVGAHEGAMSLSRVRVSRTLLRPSAPIT